MRRETKIDWMVFLFAAVFGTFGFLVRQRLDKQFEDMVPRGKLVESGPVGSLFGEILGEEKEGDSK